MKQKTKHILHAGLTSWIMIMFGFTIILYFFGFTSLWASYNEGTNISGMNVDDPDILGENQEGKNWLALFMGNILNTMFIAGEGILTAVSLFDLWKGKGTLLQWTIPLGLLLFLNIFIFPVSALQGSFNQFSFAGVPVEAFTLGFFNLFYVLTMVEFISGRQG